MPWLDKIGWPLAIMIGGAAAFFWIIRGVWAWGKPHVDRWIDANVKAKEAESARHQAMSESMTKLVDKTIEIQEATAAVANEVKEKVNEIYRRDQRHK